MKKTMLICGLLLFLIVAWFAVGRHEPKQASPARAESPQPDQARRESGSVPPVAAEKVTSPEDAENDALEAASAAERERDRQEREERERRDYNTPITFYGVVVDQFEQRVFHARVAYASVGGSFEGERELFTDKEGLFTIGGIRGKRLRIIVSHPDYYDFDQTHAYYIYASNDRGPDYRPDPTKREIFRLRKKGEAAELVRQRTHVLFDEAEPARSFSLFDHTRRRDRPEYVILQRVETAERDAQGNPIRRLEMVVPEGGIQQRTDPYVFTAPADGYQTSMYFMRPPYGGQLDYFVRFDNGNTARFTIMGSSGDYLIESYLNPDGSPNLEYDPAREINFVRNNRAGIDLIYPPKDEPPPKP